MNQVSQVTDFSVLQIKVTYFQNYKKIEFQLLIKTQLFGSATMSPISKCKDSICKKLERGKL